MKTLLPTSEVSYVLEADPRADAHAVPEAPACDAPTTRRIIASNWPSPTTKRGPEGGREADLEILVRPELAHAMDGSDYALCHAGSHCDATSSATRTIASSVSSGYMGKDSTSRAACSATGKAPRP